MQLREYGEANQRLHAELLETRAMLREEQSRNATCQQPTLPTGSLLGDLAEASMDPGVLQGAPVPPKVCLFLDWILRYLFEKTLLYRDLQDYHRLVDGYQAMEEILILGYLGEKVFWVREYQKKKHKILVVKGQLRWRLQRDCYDRGGKIVAGVKRHHPHQYLLNLKGHLYWRR